MKSAFIGTFVGAVPGKGTDIAAFLYYGEAKRSSKHPEEFGKGSIEGVAAPEAGNNACVNGAMIPCSPWAFPGRLHCGYPWRFDGARTATGTDVVCGETGGDIHGIRSTITSNIFMIVLGLTGARFFAKVLSLPKSV